MSGRIIGTLTVPVYSTLPPTGNSGQVASYNNTLYQWDGNGWVPLWPLFISNTPPATSAQKYLWINTSGTDPTIWVEDGT